jgi:hypothetical protein
MMKSKGFWIFVVAPMANTFLQATHELAGPPHTVMISLKPQQSFGRFMMLRVKVIQLTAFLANLESVKSPRAEGLK